MQAPRYYFVVRADGDGHDDPDGMVLPGPLTAKEHAQRVVYELKEGGYNPPGATLDVLDEAGQTIHSIPF